MQPLVGKYLSASFNSLKDRNNVVRKYYASAIGHLIGVAKVRCALIDLRCLSAHLFIFVYILFRINQLFDY